MVVPPAFNRTEANVADDPTPTITEQERKTLDKHQFALATAAEAVKNGVANYNACLAELQEVAAPIAARLRADYEAGSPASVKPWCTHRGPRSHCQHESTERHSHRVNRGSATTCPRGSATT